MGTCVLAALVLIMAVSVVSCAKQEATLEEMAEPVSMEMLTATGNTTQATPGIQPVATVARTLSSAAKIAQEPPLPPQGPYKPAAKDIQGALKNAGYYAGAIDGKIGPMTKKAISDFQEANGLVVDGKVGPKTWAVLGKYLTANSTSRKSP